MAQKRKGKIMEWVLAFFKKHWVKGVGLILFFIINPVVCIGTGRRGVVANFGSVSDRILGEGINFVIPVVQSVKNIDVRIQKVEANSTAPSSDLQEIHTMITLTYHLSPNQVNKLYQEIGMDYEDTIIVPAILETMKHVTAQFTASDLVTKRESVSLKIHELLHTKLGKFYILVDEVSMKDFEFSKTFSESIELKQKAEQDALRAKNELERVKIEAEQQIVNAKAEAETLRLKSQQITPMMVEMERIKKWDGKYPDTYLGSGSNTLFQIK
ncbi:prohibitin family protein [Leptospira santarosai]|uniref:SPFH domain/Band 7 family protein n=2 Tax=Leptospira santarosai TaxID=28183 RepID=M6ULJ7_9LEPT|nr:prohibitin family protein [Leptospira santarosai]AVV80898.1 SPFH domain/Band 7 family protein [Leptospira santarosai]EMO45987.1 SPFH domain/Band 7 family protein [Leptospira santarosai str. ZUN179]EMP01228.1 SPFH domain/Band 7 family protein [Leptospira santarosai str. HAI1380]